MNLTKDEKKVIKVLKDLEDNWPESLWLFSAGGGLNIMKKDEENRRAYLTSGEVDPDYIVLTIDIENDGGDW